LVLDPTTSLGSSRLRFDFLVAAESERVTGSFT
jgi:hypothetical protein